MLSLENQLAKRNLGVSIIIYLHFLSARKEKLYLKFSWSLGISNLQECATSWIIRCSKDF